MSTIFDVLLAPLFEISYAHSKTTYTSELTRIVYFVFQEEVLQRINKLAKKRSVY